MQDIITQDMITPDTITQNTITQNTIAHDIIMGYTTTQDAIMADPMMDDVIMTSICANLCPDPPIPWRQKTNVSNVSNVFKIPDNYNEIQKYQSFSNLHVSLDQHTSRDSKKTHNTSIPIFCSVCYLENKQLFKTHSCLFCHICYECSIELLCEKFALMHL